MLTPHSLKDSIIDRISGYVLKCEEKLKFHQQQSINALNFYNLFGIINVSLSSSQFLVIMIQGILGSSNITLAITGAVFAFAALIFSRLSMSYAFNALSVQHSNVSDNFTELAQQFKLLGSDLEKDAFDEVKFELYVHRFISVTEKSHLQTVRECRLISCCC